MYKFYQLTLLVRLDLAETLSTWRRAIFIHPLLRRKVVGYKEKQKKKTIIER